MMDMASPLSGAEVDHSSDERLTELARLGDQAAFAMIVQRYQTELLAHARRLVPDGRADDVVQQAFLNAWSALSAECEVSHLRGWLHTIVRNAATRAQRRSRRRCRIRRVAVSHWRSWCNGGRWSAPRYPG
jgi:RNA polymerase sigma-70 factor (ECF subfamily)